MRAKLNNTLDLINTLACKYEVFDRFGHNLVASHYLNKLYTAKLFATINSYFYNPYKEPLVTPNTPKVEFEVYELMVSNLLPFNFWGSLPQKYILAKIFISNKALYDYEEILKNPIILTLATLGESVSTYFFDNFYISINDYPELKTIPGLSFLESIPLSTLLKVSKEKHKDLYNLYRITIKNPHKHDYHMPEGINSINLNADIENDGKITEELMKQVQNKLYIFPKSLISYAGSIFSYITIGCRLNYGLKYLYLNEHNILKELIIPSTVKRITNTDNRPLKIDNIVFENYPDSQLLQDEEALTQLIKILFYCKVEESYFNGIETITKENKYKVKYNIFPTFNSFLLQSQHKALEFYLPILQHRFFYEETTIGNTIHKIIPIPDNYAKDIVLEIYKSIREHLKSYQENFQRK